MPIRPGVSGASLNSLVNLSNRFGNGQDLGSFLPPGMDLGNQIAFRSLVIEVDLTRFHLESIGITLGTPRPWALNSDFQVNEVELELMLSNPADTEDREVRTAVQGLLQLGGTTQLRLHLSDKYPEQYRSLFSDSPSIGYYPKFLDAREVPAGQKGFRTLFTAFHHFRPEDAQQVLQDAVDKQCPIAIFEFTERTRERLKGMWKSPRLAYQITPKLRPKSRGRIFWTYVLPVIPMIYLWDGWVSHWRTYTVEELEGMALATGAENYRWDIGQIEVKGTSNKITYLIGIPGP